MFLNRSSIRFTCSADYAPPCTVLIPRTSSAAAISGSERYRTVRLGHWAGLLSNSDADPKGTFIDALVDDPALGELPQQVRRDPVTADLDPVPVFQNRLRQRLDSAALAVGEREEVEDEAGHHRFGSPSAAIIGL
jgi:hypothetical protein